MRGWVDVPLGALSDGGRERHHHSGARGGGLPASRGKHRAPAAALVPHHRPARAQRGSAQKPGQVRDSGVNRVKERGIEIGKLGSGLRIFRKRVRRRGSGGVVGDWISGFICAETRGRLGSTRRSLIFSFFMLKHRDAQVLSGKSNTTRRHSDVSSGNL